jgi:cytochrome b561
MQPLAHNPRRRLRNDEQGYGLVTKALHWLMVAAMATQFVVGYLLDAGGQGRGRGRGRGIESGRGRGGGGDLEPFGDDRLLTLHVVLGLTILSLAVVRLVWRRTTPLPPWAPTLSSAERRMAHWTENALYVLMFAIPITGLWLVLAGDDDMLVLHVAGHIAFFVAVAFHVGLVLKHQFVNRDRLLRRML